MSKPKIDYSKCDSCGTCVEICPMDVFKKDEDDKNKKVKVDKPNECIGCRACEVQCPKGAIKVDD